MGDGSVGRSVAISLEALHSVQQRELSRALEWWRQPKQRGEVF